MEKLNLYQVANNDHTIIVHAIDEEDAIYCANEGWPGEVQGANVSLVEYPKDYSDLDIGVMRDIKKLHCGRWRSVASLERTH